MAEPPVIFQKFKHEPLDLTRSAIRVFYILPGTGIISCSMKHVDLNSERTACSYVWGDSQPSRAILINKRPFLIRENLHDFILRMRKDEYLKPLWVDALCIDQSNTSERNHQVRQMGSIYRDARAVISWLGQGHPIAAEFMQFARIVSKEVAEERAARLGTSKSTKFTTLFYRSVDRHRWDGHRWSLHRWELPEFDLWVETFCYLEYFTRTWIVQEVFLAPEVHTAIYGDISIAWVDLKHIVLACIKMPGSRLSQSPVTPFIQTSIYHPYTADSGSVFGIITKFAETECSDPRDHVFALHSLWDSSTFPIQVDYNLSSFSLFLKLASWLLTSEIQPMSKIIALIDALRFGPEDFAHRGELYETEDFPPITLSAAWSREINMRELRENRAMRPGLGAHKVSERRDHTTAHDLHFYTCEHCIQPDLPETTIFREYVLRSKDHDRTKRPRMPEQIQLAQIIGPKTYWGVVEGSFTDSDAFLVITPACLNRVSELPHVEERDGEIAISLSLRCLCELFNHLRPNEVEDEEGRVWHWERAGYWGIDCNKMRTFSVTTMPAAEKT